MKHTIIAIAVTAVIVGAGAFYGGMRYDQMNASSRLGSTGQFRFNQNGSRGTRTNANFAGGQVVSVDQSSITVKTQDGGSRIVFVNSGVAVTKNAAGSLADIKPGDDIMVQGTSNADGSVTAQSIQIRPVMPSPNQ